MKKRNLGQKITFIFDLVCYICAVAFIGASFYYAFANGTENPIFVRFAASVVFFVGAGVVLHVMGSIDMPNLKVPRH